MIDVHNQPVVDTLLGRHVNPGHTLEDMWFVMHQARARGDQEIIQRAVETEATTLIIATEDGVFHQIEQKAPQKQLIQAPGLDESCACNDCPHMKLNTMEKLYLCLRDLEPRIEMDEDLRRRALLPLERMLAL